MRSESISLKTLAFFVSVAFASDFHWPSAYAHDGPSFDCTKAVSKREKTVCANPTLSGLDRDLAHVYAKTESSVPAKWKRRFRKDQRAWLAFADKTCLPGNLAYLGGNYADCLAGEYRGRIEELGDTLKDIAGLRVITFARHTARRATGKDLRYGNLPHALQRNVIIQQIIEPNNRSATAWNAMIRRQVKKATAEYGVGDEQIAVLIESSAPGFIQASLSYLDEGVGPGAGVETSTALPWLLDKYRMLRPADIFQKPSAISGVLTRLAIPLLEANFKQDDNEYSLTRDQVEALVTPMIYWSIKSGGIAINPDNNNGVGPSNLTAFELSIVIPWADLRPYLRSDMPFDVSALQDAP